MEFTGTSAIVTGAASGLGAATAAALAGRGVSVHGIDLADSIAAAEPAQGVTLHAADVTDAAAVADVVTAASADAQLRTVVNCAGIAPSARIVGRKGHHDLDLFNRTVQINLIGTFTVLTLAAEAMVANEPDDAGQRGVVVNTASIAAYDGQIGQAAYASSKGGIVSLTLSAARDLAQHGVRVCTIAPGIVDSPMLAKMPEEVRGALAESVPFPPRLARPAEFAELALMVVDHEYLNGEVIRMDGALRMAPR